MRILNLYAGVGGNIELLNDTDHEITNIELNPKIAAVLQRRKPNQKVIVTDAHQFLIDNVLRPCARLLTGTMGLGSTTQMEQGCCYVKAAIRKLITLQIWKQHN